MKLNSTFVYCKSIFNSSQLEAYVWIISLVLLYNIDQQLVAFQSICPFHLLGIHWCPGCGLGRSISLFMHGDIQSSFEMHWLGIPTFFCLLYRIISIFYYIIINYKYLNE